VHDTETKNKEKDKTNKNGAAQKKRSRQ